MPFNEPTTTNGSKSENAKMKRSGFQLAVLIKDKQQNQLSHNEM